MSRPACVCLCLLMLLLLSGCCAAASVETPAPPAAPEAPLRGEETAPGETDAAAEPGTEDGDAAAEREETPFAADFSDAAFVGDSRTKMLQVNTGLTTADFYAAVGLNVRSALSKEKIELSDGTMATVPEALRGRQYRRIYVMLGFNELGWVYDEVFRDEYVALLEAIREVQPDAVLFVQTIFPVTKEHAEKNDVENNERLALFNRRVREAAGEVGAELIDTAALFDDGEGNLPADAAGDGVHLRKAYCEQWLNYLREAAK